MVNNVSRQVTFPVAFPNQYWCVTATIGQIVTGNVKSPEVGSVGTSSFNLIQVGTVANTVSIYWTAVGY